MRPEGSGPDRYSSLADEGSPVAKALGEPLIPSPLTCESIVGFTNPW